MVHFKPFTNILLQIRLQFSEESSALAKSKSTIECTPTLTDSSVLKQVCCKMNSILVLAEVCSLHFESENDFENEL